MLGRAIRPDVTEALRKPPSLEARRRYEALLNKMNETGPARLRMERLTETLQLIGTPDAQRLLKDYVGDAAAKTP